MVAACIRLGHKYQMTEMCDRAVRYLKSYFTTDLEVWEKGTDGINLPPGWELEHAIGVVNLARLTGEYTILPTALFCCCLLGDKLVYGADIEREHSMETLSGDDTAACVRAIPELMREAIITYLNVYSPLPKEAEAHPDCEHILTLLKDVMGERLDSVNLRALLFGRQHGRVEECVCAQCLEAVSERRNNRAKDMWKQLPAFFKINVPGW